ncbi:BTAD domain-containing putative transcriptional regulator [Archangium violaceum]|uniref:BTAD domain-containing putative transcriptional regulator n=1 Tax=Archangium violaceum TaxID=83451 RepID=UPI000697B3C7|nr:AAA family ATPase [Archangium violaceum]
MEIRLLGETWAVSVQGERVSLEQKTAALLAYLALEGATARSRLVGMLWPTTEEAAARGNLRQVLLRLRRLLGEECIEGRAFLRLRDGITLDVLHLRAALEARDDARAVSYDGELLKELNYPKCDDLNEWLDGWRLDLRHRWLEAMGREVQRLEREGRLTTALEGARQLLARERTSETAYQHLMRLHYLLGNRTAALEAYRQCQVMLMSEFQTGPSPATRELARIIERSESTPQRPAPVGRPVRPLLVTHSHVLAGRERAWAAMETAWAERKPMFVDGVAGIGKSRLVTEFARSRGNTLLLNARPGDREGGSFRTHMRNLRHVLEQKPEVQPRGWVRKELSRLVPKLETRPLPPPSSPQERSRLFSALAEFLRDALRDVKVLIYDDAHYMDRDSAELGLQLHSEFNEEMVAGRFPLIINVYRTTEIREAWERQLVQNARSAGLMKWVTVERLDTEAVRVMLRAMGDSRLEQVAEEMAAYTGGNPFFIVETSRHLLESGTFNGRFPSSLPPPERVRAIIEQRLNLLPEEALRLARVFAVARTDFSVQLAAFVLEVPVSHLARPLQLLLDAHLFQDRWFVHDVVGEVLLATLPEAIRKVLSERVDEYRRLPR